MLIPQFSIRWLLGVTAVVAVVFSIVGMATRGSHWAAGVSIAVGSLVVLMLVHVLSFGLVWVFSVLTVLLGRKAGTARSPFRRVPPAGAAPARDKDAPAAPQVFE